MAAVLLAACGKPEAQIEEQERFAVGGHSFSVPARHVRSIKRDSPGFVRINDPDSPLELIFDARLQGRTDQAGAPLLFGVNDGEYPRLSYWRTRAGARVVCREAVAAPRGGCGTAVETGGATWTVLFPQGRMGEADAMRRRAKALLERYRR